MIFTQMLESGVGVYPRESAVHYTDSEPFAVNAIVHKILPSEAFQLVG